MKISECDIDCYLVCWYGVDKNGYIFYSDQGGTPYIPEFVCTDFMNGSKEHTFLDFFFYTLEWFNLENRKYIQELKKDIVSDKIREIFNNYLPESNYIQFALQGITPFEILDGLTPLQDKEFQEHPYHYRKIVNPTDILNTKLLHIDQLPEDVKKIIDSHRVDVDIQKDDYFYIPSVWDSPLFEKE